MRIIRLTGLVFVVVAAMSCTTASSVSAFSSNPLFTPASGQTVTGEGGASTLKAAGFVISCTANHVVSGNVSSGLLIGGVVIHYLGCTFIKGEEVNCLCPAQSPGGGEGLILTKTLHGILGLLLPSNKTGVLLLPQSTKVITTLAKAEKEGKVCAPESTVEGTVAAEISPVGSRQTTGKITVLATAKPAIDLTHGLGTATAKLVAFAETGTIEQSDSVTFGESTEVT